MMTVMATHDVDDVKHWLASPKRAEFFNAHGMTVREFVDPAGSNRVGVLIGNVPDMDTLAAALQTPAAAAAMEHDGVHPDTIVMLVES